MTTDDILKFIETHQDLLLLIVGSIYELFVRLYPTSKNWSIIDRAVKIISFFLPNKRKPDALDPIAGDDYKKNIVTVNRSKHIIKCLLVLFIACSALPVSAQLNGTFKTVRFTPAQDTVTLNLTPSTYPIGTVIREINSDSLYMKYGTGFWGPIGGSGSGAAGLTTADNGLTVNPAGNVQLGGSLLQNTDITDSAPADFNVTLDQGGGLTLDVTGNNIGIQSDNGDIQQIAENGAINFQTITTGGITFTSVDAVDISAGSAATVTGGTNLFLISQNNNIEANSAAEFLVTATTNIVTSAATTSILSSGATDIGAGTDLGLSIGGHLAINASSGNAGDVLTSGGAGVPPTWSPGGGVTADNGLTAAANNVQLGGSLIQNTTVTGGGFDLSFGTFGSRLDVSRTFATQLGLVGDDVTIVADGGAGTINLSVPGNMTFQQTTDVNADFLQILKQQTLNSGISGAHTNFVITSAGGSANGFGMRFDYELSSSTGPIEVAMEDELILTDATTGSENVSWTKQLTVDGTMTDAISITTTPTENQIIFNRLPTACTGMPTGTLANVSGTLTVCP